jgi:hypothetical protein
VKARLRIIRHHSNLRGQAVVDAMGHDFDASSGSLAPAKLAGK